MYKLIILIEQPEDEDAFNERWAQFLFLADQIPTLVRAATARVDHRLYGSFPCTMVHELFFEDANDASIGLNSAKGKKAGQMLQLITGGKVTLLLAEHHEDSGENLRGYHQPRGKEQEHAE